MDIQTIRVPEIQLHWSDWTPWNHLKRDARCLLIEPAVNMPQAPGVYEVRRKQDGDEKPRLAIRASRSAWVSA
jgi:hypothetical protein